MTGDDIRLARYDIRLALRDIITVLKDMRKQHNSGELVKELCSAYDIIYRQRVDHQDDYWLKDADDWLKRNARYGD